MKGYKFLVLVGDSERMVEELTTTDQSVVDQIVPNEIPFMRSIKCVHEYLPDNMVLLDTAYGPQEFVRDTNGHLWYVEQWFSKAQLVNEFE